MLLGKYVTFARICSLCAYSICIFSICVLLHLSVALCIDVALHVCPSVGYVFVGFRNLRTTTNL